MISRMRDGSPIETYDGEGKLIEELYQTRAGKMILPLLISPFVSKTAGAFLDSPFSLFLIKPFIRKNQLDLRDYPKRTYASFNDFFTRAILPGRRPVDMDENILVSPCDGKLTVFPLEEDSHFQIKGCDYTLKSLLRSSILSKKYCGGYGILIRLTVDDYHRYMYPVSGRKGRNFHISGVYHTVNPRAAMARPIYRENSREYTLLKSRTFGTLLMMEIGAMLVGRIKNLHGPCKITRGKEKGYFEFGGSSIILLLEKDRFIPDADLLKHSAQGEETIVKQGERIGRNSFTIPQ